MFAFLSQNPDFAIAIAIFAGAFLAIIFDIFDKALIALVGGLLLILTGVLGFEEAVRAINFEIIALLASMMILVEIAQESGLFSLVNFKLAQYSRGNPFLIFLFFTLVTAVSSAFLDNVTTILIVVPITIALVSGMGYSPLPYVMAEIMLANVGGALTIVGDPTAVLVGTAAKFSFNEFMLNMAVPVAMVIVLILTAFYLVKWKELKPINHHLPKLFLSNLLLQKLQYQYTRSNLNVRYMTTVVAILLLTIVGFTLHHAIDLPIAVIAATGALTLMLAVHKKISVHHVFSTIEWSTLGFFSGLFVLVSGLEKVGLLDMVAGGLMGVTDNLAGLLLIVLWSAGLLSMVVDNIPFVTVMIPVIFDIQTKLAGQEHLTLLWWALVLGAVLGGNGTLIGASANVIGSDIARKNGVKLNFITYFKYSFPLTLIALTLASGYLLARYYWF